MKPTYQPPVWGKNSWIQFLQGVGVAVLLFLLLPLTQYFTSTEIEEPEARTVDTAPPPPPPPPVEEPEPPAEAATQASPTPEPPRPEPPPMSLRQLELSLDPEPGTAAGDFAMNFDLRPEGAGGVDVFDVSDVDQPPRAVSARPPRYPRELQTAGISGAVDLIFVVGRDGAVSDIRVEHSDHRALERPAVDAVRAWRFMPGEHQGEPARVMVRQTLQFEVE